MLIDRAGDRFRLSRALGWSFTWALGVAIGVALGGWLTLVGGSGAPGAEALDPLVDLVVLPGAAFAAVFIVQLIVRAAVAAARGRTQDRRKGEDQQERSEDDGITR